MSPGSTMSPLPSFEIHPSGGLQAASARLRGIGLARELQRLGCSVSLGQAGAADVLADALPDVLVVQKTASPEIVLRALAVRANGGQVVFDIDDWGDALPWAVRDPALLADLLAACTVVSVDTAQRAEVLRRDPAYAAIPHCWVLPDPVDYVDGALPAAAPAAARPPGKLAGCWFGNGPNLAPALPYLQAALGTDKLGRFSVITNSQFVAQLQLAMPMLAVEAWQLETFAARLRDHDFCLLVHDTNTEGLQKSNNKMLAALGQGVVPLVSNTPAYAQTARLIGIPELVFDSPADLARRIDPAQIAALRQRIQGPACQQLLQQLLPASVAADFLARVQALRQAPAALLTTPAAPTPPAEAVPIRLNLGCGDMLLPGYVNVDVAAERRGRQPDVVCDIRDLSAFPDNHADEVMAIHVIEHFYRWEVVDLIKEWVRVLKPGGQLVLECPNLLSACEALLAKPEQAAQPGQAGSRTMWCFYGDPSWQDPLMCHRWLYTPQSLAQVMHEAGLRELAQKAPQFKARHPRDMRVVGSKPVTLA